MLAMPSNQDCKGASLVKLGQSAHGRGGSNPQPLSLLRTAAPGSFLRVRNKNFFLMIFEVFRYEYRSEIAGGGS